jgi:hypothetical protein
MRCWFPRSGQIPSKVVGKYKEIFFLRPNSRGQPAQVKIFQR